MLAWLLGTDAGWQRMQRRTVTLWPCMQTLSLGKHSTPLPALAEFTHGRKMHTIHIERAVNQKQRRLVYDGSTVRVWEVRVCVYKMVLLSFLCRRVWKDFLTLSLPHSLSRLVLLPSMWTQVIQVPFGVTSSYMGPENGNGDEAPRGLALQGSVHGKCFPANHYLIAFVCAFL